jgi:phenylacetaldehyde dehydrogenase
MWKLADLLESHADEVAQLESVDNGKPIRDARNVDLPGSYERQQGAKVVTGGRRIGDQAYFVQPTVLTDAKPGMSAIREEIFGPVVCAIPFDDDDLDRIARTANDTSYGLAASIWTRDLGTAHKLARRIKAGTVWINTDNFGDPALPFGGYKQSGWGREMGYEAIELYTEVKR